MSSFSINKLNDILIQRIELEKIDISDFLLLHKSVESYFRRLLYISLRLKNQSDKDAKKIVQLCSLNSNEILAKAFDLLSQSAVSINGQKCDFKYIESKYVKFKTLFRYYRTYSSRHRNLYLHGISDSISPETIRLAYIIEKKLLLELEAILKKEYKKTCKDTPTNWGAKRISKNELRDIAKRMQEFKLGNKGDSPIQNSSLKKGLKNIFTQEEIELLKMKN